MEDEGTQPDSRRADRHGPVLLRNGNKVMPRVHGRLGF